MNYASNRILKRTASPLPVPVPPYKTLLHMQQSFAAVFSLVFAAAGLPAAAPFQVRETVDLIDIRAPAYRLEIAKQNFRYGFTRPDGAVIAPANAEF